MSKSFRIAALVLVISVLGGIYYMKNVKPAEQISDIGEGNEIALLSPDRAVTFEEAMDNDLPTFVEFKTST